MNCLVRLTKRNFMYTKMKTALFSHPQRRLTTLAGLIMFSFLIGGWIFFQSDYYLAVKKNLKMFGEIYKYISDRYVEDVHPHDLIRAGIDGMLDGLDPYTAFYEGAESGDLDLLMTGQYGGIGISIGMKNKAITVISVMDGSPAQRAGLRPGDRITGINGESTQNLRLEQLSQKVKGEPGTELILNIQREEGLPPIEVRMKREIILVDNIAYAGTVKDRIGYVKLNRFSKTAASDLQKILYDFRKDSLKGIILDLRGNSGGMLDAAVDISNFFIRKGELITYTRGRMQESVRQYTAENEPILTDIPLVVLVDGGSASASEIVAGAIQDLDRGVIIGEKTFGKGLVQTVYPIEGKSMLKITTAKYYTPSGRCIQKEFYPFRKKAKEEAGEDWQLIENQTEDSLSLPPKPVFRTKNGRPVFASGGIIPDVVIQSDSAWEETTDLVKQGLVFDFATYFVNRHPQWDSNFMMHDSIMELMNTFVRQKGYTYRSVSEKELDDLRKAIAKEGLSDSASPLLTNLENLIRKNNFHQAAMRKRGLMRVLELELAGRYFGNRFRIKRSFQYDPAIRTAIEILGNANHYYSMLGKK